MSTNSPDPNKEEFSNVEIDVDEKLLTSLAETIGIEFEGWMHPCSYSLWKEGVSKITEMDDLHKLVGECYVNDHLVELVMHGIEVEGFDEEQLGLFEDGNCMFCGYELTQKDDKYSCTVCEAEGLDK